MNAQLFIRALRTAEYAVAGCKWKEYTMPGKSGDEYREEADRTESEASDKAEDLRRAADAADEAESAERDAESHED